MSCTLPAFDSDAVASPQSLPYHAGRRVGDEGNARLARELLEHCEIDVDAESRAHRHREPAVLLLDRFVDELAPERMQ
jgi:hypothetical protein